MSPELVPEVPEVPEADLLYFEEMAAAEYLILRSEEAPNFGFILLFKT